MTKRRWVFAVSILLLALLILWFSGLLPKQVAKIAADSYMAKQENSNSYEFKLIDYSSAHDSYFVKYTSKDEEQQNRVLEIPSKYFPFLGVFSDSKYFAE